LCSSTPVRPLSSFCDSLLAEVIGFFTRRLCRFHGGVLSFLMSGI
jgi:hypothetical protein